MKDMLELIADYNGLLAAGTLDAAAAVSSLLFEMAEEEANTNRRYAAAFAFAKKVMREAGNEEAAAYIEAIEKDVMAEEDKHCTEFKYGATELIGMTEEETELEIGGEDVRV